ncbi:MAG: hypothetical protein K2X94_04275 [Amoebophilaceae bacterium]|nr:hypothetical protein [Amoebophilaceae bacterium]
MIKTDPGRQNTIESSEQSIEAIQEEETEALLSVSPKFAAVLLHGLMANVDELDKIAESLRSQFGPSVLVIQPNSRGTTGSLTQSVSNQAKNIFKEIEVELVANKQVVKTLPIVIIGYSQGGVVGCTIAKYYADQLNIQGVVTINAPLMGTSLLRRTPTDLGEFMAKAEPGLSIVRDHVQRIYQEQEWRLTLKTVPQIKRTMWQSTFGLKYLIGPKWMPIPYIGGLKDIFPDSSAVRQVYDFLRRENSSIPCLLISSYQDDFADFFNLDIETNDNRTVEAIEGLNQSYAKFTTGKEEGKHDTLIPLASQLCRGDSFDDLASLNFGSYMDPIIIDMPGNPLVEGRIYKDISHAGNLIALDVNLFKTNPAIDTVITADAVIRDILSFVQEKVLL